MIKKPTLAPFGDVVKATGHTAGELSGQLPRSRAQVYNWLNSDNVFVDVSSGDILRVDRLGTWPDARTSETGSDGG